MNEKDYARSQRAKDAVRRRKEIASQLYGVPTGELMTTTELAQHLSVSRPTLGSWAKKGIITAYGYGHARFYIKSEVLRSLRALS